MNEESNNSVLDSNRLKDGTIWPMPILLDISSELSKNLKINDKLALRDKEGYLIAILTHFRQMEI